MVTEAKFGNITYNDFAGTNPQSVVSVGAEGKERQLVNVAAGAISQTSTDAINGSQLYATNQVIGNMAKSLDENVLGAVSPAVVVPSMLLPD